MVEVELSMERLIKIWWSLLWRGLLFCILAGFISGFIIGFVSALAHVDRTIATLLSYIVGALISIPIGIWVVKLIIKKRFRDFHIALISNIV